jgi:hypothetical protein
MVVALARCSRVSPAMNIGERPTLIGDNDSRASCAKRFERTL